jgi:hypothetical protein
MSQIATPPPPLAPLYATDPTLGHALLDLEPRLTRAAEITIAGLNAKGATSPPETRAARQASGEMATIWRGGTERSAPGPSSPPNTASISRLADASIRGAWEKRAR